MEAKELKTEAVVGLSSGITLCNFDELHEAAEWIAGHPIWTHEFADKKLWTRLKAIIAQHRPDLAEVALGEMTQRQAEKKAAELRVKFGPTVSFPKGNCNRTESPIDSAKRIIPGKPVIAVETK